MQIVKFIILFFIGLSSGYIGVLISKKYLNRVEDLKEVKTALNIFIAKIKFTYQPIPEIFKDISNKLKEEVGQVFLNASEKMKNMPAGDAWNKALKEHQTSLTKEDIQILKNLSNLLRKG